MTDSASEPASQLPSVEQGGARTLWQSWDLWALVIPALSMLPMLVVQGVAVWSRVPMRFGVLVLAVVVGVSWYHCHRSSTTRHPIRWRVAVGTLVTCALLYAYSVWNFSPWLTHLAAVGTFFAWALGRWGYVEGDSANEAAEYLQGGNDRQAAEPRTKPTGATWMRVAAVSLLLLTTLPLPKNWDQSFDGWHKQTASSFASHTLDTFQVPNLLAGGSLRTEFLTISTDELTTYGSVFALIAWGICLCLFRHRSLLQGFLVTLAAIILYVMTVYFAVCLTVYLQRQYGVALIPEYLPWIHAGQLLTAMALVVMFDTGLGMVFRTVPVSEPDFVTIFYFGNKLLHWPQVDPQESVVPDDPEERELFEQQKLAEISERRVWPATDWQEQLVMRWSVYLSCGLLGTVALAPFWLMARGELLAPPPAFRTPSVEELAHDFPKKDSLPQRIGSWQMVEYEIAADEIARLEWRYNWRGQLVIAHVSFPHVGPLVGPPAESGSALLKDGRDKESIQFSQLVNALGSRTYVFSSSLNANLEPQGKPKRERKTQLSSPSPLYAKLFPEAIDRDKLNYWIIAECEPGVALQEAQLREFQASFEAFRAEVAAALPRDAFNVPAEGEG
ncbi:MAG: archaeosortase/exosortase family protein [Pirellulaceae bacterium]